MQQCRNKTNILVFLEEGPGKVFRDKFVFHSRGSSVGNFSSHLAAPARGHQNPVEMLTSYYRERGE